LLPVRERIDLLPIRGRHMLFKQPIVLPKGLYMFYGWQRVMHISDSGEIGASNRFVETCPASPARQF
jgi:hypothetical protein